MPANCNCRQYQQNRGRKAPFSFGSSKTCLSLEAGHQIGFDTIDMLQPGDVFVVDAFGNLDAGEFKTRSSDEIGTLSAAMDRMKTSLVQAMKMLDA